MIEGRFEEETNRLFFEIGLVTASGELFLVEALLDTGFTGWVAVNSQDLESLSWEMIDEKLSLTTARGEGLFNVYAGIVQIDDREFNIPVVAGDEIPEILIGMEWLKTKRLVVDLAAGILTLG
ncbi:MAG: aspartyl protease [Oscillatoriales cyanobacterium RU_3_3]|nr:aspartyl protease [Oscillatoriales cyanobacterium RU_3_3]